VEERRKSYGVLKMVVLSTVLKKGRAHGYEIYKTLENLAPSTWRPSQGTLYRVLNEMVEEGLLSKEVVENRRRIAYYTATEKGIEFFLESVREFLAKLSAVLPLTLEAFTKVVEERGEEGRATTIAEILRELIEGIRRNLHRIEKRSPGTQPSETTIS